MLFLAASKGTWCGFEEPWERKNMVEHCSNTEMLFRAVRDRYALLTSKQKQKLRDEEKTSKIE